MCIRDRLGRWLTLLTENGVDYAALALSGGAKENVIPKESSITLVLPAGITEGCLLYTSRCV